MRKKNERGAFGMVLGTADADRIFKDAVRSAMDKARSGPVRTLSEFTPKERVALQRQYGCRVRSA